MRARSLVAAAATAAALAGGVALAAPAMADDVPAYDLKCTNMINYAGDPRSNAEINGIGYNTGTCPPPIPGAR
jgi:hypothetical protein